MSKEYLHLRVGRTKPGTQFNNGSNRVLLRRRRRVVVDENSFKHVENFLFRCLEMNRNDRI